MKKFAIVVAGGSGTRMNTEIPKQFIPLAGKPILMHTLDVFSAYSPDLPVILVLPTDQLDTWGALCEEYGYQGPEKLIAGGHTRFHSVLNGLNSIDADEGLVAVHDGVRPFLSQSILSHSFDKAGEVGSAVTCVPLKDSIRNWQSDEKHTASDRENFRLIQTPQTFRLDWMRKAFSNEYLPQFTDCASVLEHAGFPVQLIEGSYRNIKITTPDDLLWAAAFLGV